MSCGTRALHSPPQPHTPAAVNADGGGPSTAACSQELSLFPATSLLFFLFLLQFPTPFSILNPLKFASILSCFGFSGPLNLLVLPSPGCEALASLPRVSG